MTQLERWKCLRALLIHKGIKHITYLNGIGVGLRALLIHKGIKPTNRKVDERIRLRALLIHKGIKLL